MRHLWRAAVIAQTIALGVSGFPSPSSEQYASSILEHRSDSQNTTTISTQNDVASFCRAIQDTASADTIDISRRDHLARAIDEPVTPSSVAAPSATTVTIPRDPWISSRDRYAIRISFYSNPLGSKLEYFAFMQALQTYICYTVGRGKSVDWIWPNRRLSFTHLSWTVTLDPIQYQQQAPFNLGAMIDLMQMLAEWGGLFGDEDLLPSAQVNLWASDGVSVGRGEIRAGV